MLRCEQKQSAFKGEIGACMTFDTKQLAGEGEGEFEGFASVYGNVDQGGDIVDPNAFHDSLRLRPIKRVKMLLHHDTRKLVGIWKDVKSDHEGLFVKGKLLLTTQAGQETHELMKVGALDGMSIGYRTLEHNYDKETDVRTILKADLMEVSLVTFPMNESATVSAVKAANDIKTIREFETFLRDVGGFSSNAAKAIASGGYKELNPRDEVGDEQDRLLVLKKLAQLMREPPITMRNSK